MGMVGTVAVATIHILLTSFDPFGGSSVNNSQPIVKLLAEQASAMGVNVVVSTCNLPVVYDQGAAVAMQCVEQNKPDIVVSFGEAECSLRIETAATNLDNTPDLADNAGQVRVNTPILASGPARSGFMFPVQAMYCALTSASAPVEVSVSPAAFICNNTAYHLSQELTAKGIPFSFIHVPNSRCSAEQADPATNAQSITQMLRGAISYLRHHPENQSTLPTNQGEAEALLQQWQKQNAPACQLDFVQKMISAYVAGVSD
jgi:pyroglutamyl-peptidase